MDTMAPAPRTGRGGARTVVVFAVGAILGALVGGAVAQERLAGASAPDIQQDGVRSMAPTLQVATDRPAPWTLESYEGVGTWVDVFDYAPAYRNLPAVDPAEQARAMAEAGVETIFLQAARLDERSPDGLTDRWWLAAWLLAAEANDLDVVAWYLPKHADLAADTERVRLIRDFQPLGLSVDGLGIDIEWTGDVPDHAERSASLVQWSAQVRELVGDDVVSAIVLPPVQIEVINDQYWPGFPWREIADDYDVWLPMAYSSYRTVSSGYRDSRRYSTESIERLRANIGKPDAPVHTIGGLAEEIQPGDLEGLVASMVETGALGVSVYDWDTLRPEDRPRLAEILEAQ